MKKYPPNFNIHSKRYLLPDLISPDYLDDLKKNGVFIFPQLCELAGIRNRVEKEVFIEILLDENSIENFVFLEKDKKIFIVGTKDLPRDNYYFRIIESLAYGFFDYSARETICFKNFFSFKLETSAIDVQKIEHKLS